MLRFKSHWPKLLMKYNKVKFGRNLTLMGYPYVFRRGKGTIEIGDNVTINSDPMSNMLGIGQRTYIVNKGNGSIKIGNRVGISGSSIYAWDRIEIGDGTIIGTGTKIMDTDFHPAEGKIREQHNNSAYVKTAPVTIGRNVFIGCNCIILKGTKIGDNCTIGAGSVVSGCYEAGQLIAGNPAKVIRKEKKEI